jgi:hypothetical protein
MLCYDGSDFFLQTSRVGLKGELQMSNSAVEDLSPGQAQYVLGRIIQDKKVRTREISNYLKEMDQEIRDLENRLSSLKGVRDQAKPSARRSARTSSPGKTRSRSRKKSSAARGAKSKAGAGKAKHSRKATTPEARKSRQLQGQYISLIKRFPMKERDKYKALASDKGREEAVTRMKSDLGK